MTIKFELNAYNRNTSDEELLDDLKKVAQKLEKDKVTMHDYEENGKFCYDTFKRRFGNWNNALVKAGLQINIQLNISNDELFKNLEKVWIKLGHQPQRREMTKSNSKYSESPYNRKFGTWRKALEAFVDFINSDEQQNSEKEETETIQNDSIIIPEKEIIKHKTKRNISSRLKVQVLMRDGNICKLCGITVTGENIHFDHIKPWSKGGETVLENLQVLCAKDNIAKGNLEYEKE